MTEHSKIPLPPEGPENASGNSLFERAVQKFDLGKFAPPPVPANLAPHVQKAGARYQEKLAQATHLLGGNFDGKILDLGL